MTCQSKKVQQVFIKAWTGSWEPGAEAEAKAGYQELRQTGARGTDLEQNPGHGSRADETKERRQVPETEQMGLKGTGDRGWLGKTGNNKKTDKYRSNGLNEMAFSCFDKSKCLL